MIIESQHGVSYSTSKDDLTLEDVFWLYNPKTHLGLAGFKFDGTIYVACKLMSKWHRNYEMDSRSPNILQESEVAEFISRKKKDGMVEVFNVLKNVYNGIQNYSEEEVKKYVTLTCKGAEFRDQRIISFAYRDVRHLIVDERTEYVESTFREALSMEDVTVDSDAKSELSEEQIRHRYQVITQDFRKKIPKGKIEVPIFHRNFQNIRNVFHYAVEKGNLDLLEDFKKCYVLATVEPVAEYIMTKVITSKNEEVQQFFTEKISYEDLPWQADNNFMKTMGSKLKENIKQNINGELSAKLYERYFEENFLW